ncbi:MAG: hypothetical protein KDM63_13980, partial [Verrucomicrobiae bacterium]|nr:hypothetical protein [Verrucomicrobiae bacterium]
YPHHQFLHTVGSLWCCDVGGCWKARSVPLNDGSENDSPDQLCLDLVNGLPRCMDMISVDDVVRSIERYLDGAARRTPKQAAESERTKLASAVAP